MKKQFISIFSAISIFMFGFIHVSGAQNMQHEESGLSTRQHHIVRIAALTAKGDIPHLKTALNEGLDAGLTVSETKEVLVQMYAYCGFPRSLMGINTLIAVLEERKAQNIHDHQGPQASPITDTRDKYTRGKEILETLTGRTDTGQASGFGAFSPEIDVFLKEHLFADIFERDILNYQDRELATIAALISLGGVEPMMQSHMNIGMHVGLTEPQLRQVLSIIESSVGQQEAAAGASVLDTVLASRK
jgi:alkylhydroperoxidase/carboxymuconolactone decarboxylase family protein YurZ